MHETTGLDDDQAKTIIYYAVATYGLPQLDKFPLLGIYGPAGTGKTTILGILGDIAYKPTWLDGKVTRAVLRDSHRFDATVLIDEADDMHEELLVNTYSRQSAPTTVKRRGETDWLQKTINLFGATAHHRRRPFRDPAILSRSVVVRTRRKVGVIPYRAEDFKPYVEVLKALADTVD